MLCFLWKVNCTLGSLFYYFTDRTVVGEIFQVFSFFRKENNFSLFQPRVLRIFEIGKRNKCIECTFEEMREEVKQKGIIALVSARKAGAGAILHAVQCFLDFISGNEKVDVRGC